MVTSSSPVCDWCDIWIYFILFSLHLVWSSVKLADNIWVSFFDINSSAGMFWIFFQIGHTKMVYYEWETRISKRVNKNDIQRIICLGNIKGYGIGKQLHKAKQIDQYKWCLWSHSRAWTFRNWWVLKKQWGLNATHSSIVFYTKQPQTS